MEACIEPKNLYGVWKFYPRNDVAETLAAIAGTKTLTLDVIRLAQSIGVQFVEIIPRNLGDVSMPFNVDDYK